jgi:hypothetical protein
MQARLVSRLSGVADESERFIANGRLKVVEYACE